VEHLKTRRMLVVLDNCEHLIDACAELANTLLRSCPDLKILATSREALGMAGERSWVVPSLSVPGLGRPAASEVLLRFEAVRLFVERARAVASTFELTDQNAPAVALLCQRLEGIPLAIELAAARVSALSAEQILERLENPLKLLTAGGRTAVPRHRTLRATLEWSYELLSELERKLFGRLSVFAGGFSLEAAEAVGAGDGIEEGDVLDLLSQLVDKSMVVAEARAAGAETLRATSLRYRLLEPVRQYGLERLEESGEAEQVRERHARHYLALAEAAEPQIMGPEQGVWLQRLAREHDNFRAALSWP
jgi:predicted ATPase